MTGGAGIAGSYASRGLVSGQGFDPRNLSSAPHLLAWWRASLGITLNSTLSGTGSPPTVTWSGTGSAIGLVVECNDISAGTNRGQAKFRYSLQGGVAGSWVSGVTTAASVVLFGADITLGFGTGTYGVGQTWEPVPLAWTDQVAGHVLSNPSLSQTPLIKANLFNGRAGLWWDGTDDALLCSDGLANAIVGGSDKPFSAFCVARSRTLSAANVYWSLQNTAGLSFYDFFTTLTVLASNKRGETGSVKPANGGPVDANAHVYRLIQGGVAAQGSTDKVSRFNGSQDATPMTVNNLSLGATFIGGSISNQNPIDLAELIFYDSALGADETDQLEIGLMNHYRI